MHRDYVWVPSEKTYGEVVRLLAYGAVVKYSVGGIEYEVVLDKDDFEFIKREEE